MQGIDIMEPKMPMGITEPVMPNENFTKISKMKRKRKKSLKRKMDIDRKQLLADLTKKEANSTSSAESNSEIESETEEEIILSSDEDIIAVSSEEEIDDNSDMEVHLKNIILIRISCWNRGYG